MNAPCCLRLNACPVSAPGGAKHTLSFCPFTPTNSGGHLESHRDQTSTGFHWPFAVLCVKVSEGQRGFQRPFAVCTARRLTCACALCMWAANGLVEKWGFEPCFACSHVLSKLQPLPPRNELMGIIQSFSFSQSQLQFLMEFRGQIGGEVVFSQKVIQKSQSQRRCDKKTTT